MEDFESQTYDYRRDPGVIKQRSQGIQQGTQPGKCGLVNGLPKCPRSTRSKASPWAMTTKKDTKDLIRDECRRTSGAQGFKSHTPKKGNNAGQTITRKQDVRVGKGVVEAMWGLSNNGCNSNVDAKLVLKQLSVIYAACYKATSSRKVAGRTTVNMKMFDEAVEAARNCDSMR